MNATFRVRLNGHPFDIQDVADLLRPMGYIVEQDDAKWFISGIAFELCDSASDARKAADRLIGDANSVLALSDSRFCPIDVGSTIIELLPL